jgi:hypothetical protein
MRVALIGGPRIPVSPPSYGGIEAVVDRLARDFDAAGHDCCVHERGLDVPGAQALVYARACSNHRVMGAIELSHLIACLRGGQGLRD